MLMNCSILQHISILKIKMRLDEGCEYIRQQSPNSVLTLTNTENMFFNNEMRKHFEEKVKGNEPYVKAGAIIGMTGLISIMYGAFVRITGRNLTLYKIRKKPWIIWLAISCISKK